MDMKIGAAPMTAVAEMQPVIVRVHTEQYLQVISLIERVAPSSCPSIAGHSLSAVTPDYYTNFGGLAKAAA